jgi:rubrerythrin
MPLSPEQEALCERLEKGESTPTAAALIRQQAHEIDDLWDRLSRAYALVRNETPAEMIHEEIKEIHAMLEGRGNQLRKRPAERG